jgi:hypothetical protein
MTAPSRGDRRLTKWARWQRLSARAARFQGRVLFSLLYFVIVVPTGWARFRSRADALGTGDPAWGPHTAAGRRQS